MLATKAYTVNKAVSILPGVSEWSFWIILTVLLLVALFIYFSFRKSKKPDPEPDPVRKEEPAIRSSSESSSNKIQEPERRAA